MPLNWPYRTLVHNTQQLEHCTPAGLDRRPSFARASTALCLSPPSILSSNADDVAHDEQMQLLTALPDRWQVRHVRCHRPFHRIQAICGWFKPVIREQAQLLLEFERFEAVEEADVLEVRIEAQFHKLVLVGFGLWWWGREAAK